MQHKLESGYESVKQQQCLSAAPGSSTQLLPILSNPHPRACRAQVCWKSAVARQAQIAPVLSSLLLVNIMLILKEKKKATHQKTHTNKKNPTPKTTTTQLSAQQWDSTKYCCTSNKSMSSLLCRAHCSYSCCWRQRLWGRQGSVSSLGQSSLSRAAAASLKPGIPKLPLLRCPPMTARERCAHYRKAPAGPAAAPGSVQGHAQAQRCHPAWPSPLR